MQLNKSANKGFQLYVVHVNNDISANKQHLDNFEFLKEFVYVFPKDIPGLPPKRDIDFTIDLVPRAVSISNAPYKMNTPKLVEFKIHI